jgi:hypothetical protein
MISIDQVEFKACFIPLRYLTSHTWNYCETIVFEWFFQEELYGIVFPSLARFGSPYKLNVANLGVTVL